MKTAIIGSREFKQMDLVREEIFQRLHYSDIEVITGGAKGIDAFAETYCKSENIPCEVIRPINPANKLDYLFRNVEIITKADRIIAFWDESSKGSAFTIRYALDRKKDIIVYNSKGDVLTDEKLRNLLGK